MARFNTLLCPIDFDANSLLALRMASELAKERDATLHLLHVVPLPPGPEVGVPYGQLEMKARTRLDRIARERLGDGIRYDLHVALGDAANEILQTAQRLDANLIVMATHGRKGLRRLLLGSVAEKVIRDAPCPVLSMKPAPARRASSRRPKASRARG